MKKAQKQVPAKAGAADKNRKGKAKKKGSS